MYLHPSGCFMRMIFNQIHNLHNDYEGIWLCSIWALLGIGYDLLLVVMRKYRSAAMNGIENHDGVAM